MREFQSTRPGWGGTSLICNEWFRSEFQSTRPGWGGTMMMLVSLGVLSEFQSTRPGWGGTTCQSRKA